MQIFFNKVWLFILFRISTSTSRTFWCDIDQYDIIWINDASLNTLEPKHRVILEQTQSFPETGEPTGRTPSTEYLIARSQLTKGSVGKVPFNFWWKVLYHHICLKHTIMSSSIFKNHNLRIFCPILPPKQTSTRKPTALLGRSSSVLV